MKNFDDFLEFLKNESISDKAMKEIQSSFKDSGELFTEHDMKLVQCVTKSVSVTMKEILRSYHEWSQKSE